MFYDEPSGYRISPAAAVRIDRVEDIFHLTSGFEKKYQKDTPTIVVEIWRLFNDKHTYQYSLKTEDDIRNVAKDLQAVFQNVALKYFKQYSTIEAIDHLLNDHPDENSIHYLSEPLRCAHGVIVAKLNNRANYSELCDIYRKRLRRYAGDFYLPNFEALLSNLAKVAQSESP